MDRDEAIRAAAFAFLDQVTAVHGWSLPRQLLEQGFFFEGERVPLVGPPGIFKPKVMSGPAPLSITTAPPRLDGSRPYDDEITADDHIRYRYRGDDPDHYQNAELREAMQAGIPLIYFYGLAPNSYAVVWPVFVVEDDRAGRSFSVAADEVVGAPNVEDMLTVQLRRRHVTRQAVVRLHQARFRELVLRAYQQACAVCRLRHPELLDAAHILPDGHPRGLPVVPNGLAMCTLHHKAFDSYILGIRPDYVIEINERVLEEEDGPMLIHGLQGFHSQRLVVPRSAKLKPARENLEERYEKFRRAS